MTDAELAEYLGIAGESYEAKFMAAMSPANRSLYERMHEVEVDIRLWQSGVMPKPTGVILCHDHSASKTKGDDNAKG